MIRIKMSGVPREASVKKMNASKEVEATPQVLGMVRKVEHLVKVEAVK